MSWRRASSGSHDQMFVAVWRLLSCLCGAGSVVTELKLKFKLRCDRRSVGQFVLVLGPYLWPTTRFVLLSDICSLRVVGRPPWREDGSAIYLHSLISLLCQVPKNSWPHFTLSSKSPSTWRARSPYLHPPWTGGPVIPSGTGFPFCHLFWLAGLRWRYCNPPPNGSLDWSEVEVDVTLRPTVSRPVSPGVRPPSGTRDQFFFLLYIFFRHLRVCCFVALSLTRGRFCNLLLLLVLASAVSLGLPFLTRGWTEVSQSQSQSYITTDSQSVSQSVCLGVEPNLGLLTRDIFF
jgi:hypothetical protein